MRTMVVEAPRQRAPYASDPAQGRGRRRAEPPSPTRNDFRRDCDRIIHSAAFRRLAHKTQVFGSTRAITTARAHGYSEVAQIARRQPARRSTRISQRWSPRARSHIRRSAMPVSVRLTPFAMSAALITMRDAADRDRAERHAASMVRTSPGKPRGPGHNGLLTDRAGAPIGRHEHGLPHGIRGQGQSSTVSFSSARRLQRLPMTSPTMLTISTTVCAQSCLRWMISARCRWRPL